MTVALAACGPEEEVDTTGLAAGGDFGATIQAQAEAQCVARGGRWGAGGSGGFLCYTPTRDAGQQCRIGTDCEGLCLARSRTCAPVTPFLGCHETLTDSGFPATVCVE